MFRITTVLISIVFLCNSWPAESQTRVRKPGIAQGKKSATAQTVRLQIKLTGRYSVDSIEILSAPLKWVGPRPWKKEKIKIKNDVVEWKHAITNTFYLRIESLYESGRPIFFLVEPGDNVSINSNSTYLQFSGTGSEKYRLRHQIDSILYAMPAPKNKKDIVADSFEDFFEWNTYLNRQLELIMPLIDNYKNRLSPYIFNYTRADFIDKNISARSGKFSSLIAFSRKNGFSKERIGRIYDSLYFPATAELFKWASQYKFGTLNPVKLAVHKENSFEYEKDPLKTDLKRKLLYYELAAKTYKDSVWQDFMFDFFEEQFMIEQGFIPQTEAILANYYAQPGFQIHKAHMKQLELKARKLLNKYQIADFELTDVNGKPFNQDRLKNKVALLDFWFTGCLGCVQMTPVMQEVERVFEKDTNVIFLSVSVDRNRNQWLKSISEKKYTTGTGINLYTGGKGADHRIVTDYVIDSYPTLFLVSYDGRITGNTSEWDPRKDDGKELIGMIYNQLAFLKDGPYVFCHDTTSTAYFFNAGAVQKKQLMHESSPLIDVQTDSNEIFKVELKKTLQDEPSEFAKPDRMLVMSDIEGNFDAFRKLLQANKVIDEKYNWIFEDGHLVFGGDMFDRGHQVTECLWLIYSLEKKARDAGGYVHFILGNHEIMNLTGIHKYAKKKYIDNAAILGKTLTELYSQDTELGRWLRSKNIVEKIGDILFLHGGISPEINQLPVSIAELNKVAREYLSGKSIQKDNNRHKAILSTTSGPFWYRGYYSRSQKSLVQQVDSTLRKFNVKQIVTGHTIVADTISIHFNGKVINTDTHHAEGKSEALLIENRKFYRVNMEGKKNEILAGVLDEQAATAIKLQRN